MSTLKVQTENFEVVVFACRTRGYFEHNILGDGGGGGLWFTEDKHLRDYDGVYTLPAEVTNALESLGFNTSEDY